MKYGIIGAMDEEVKYLYEQMTKINEINIANSLFIEGRLKNKNIVLLKSGIGKVNAAMTTTILIERFQPSIVINTGSAGGFSQSLTVGDIVISDEVVHHDVDATVFNYSHGQVPQLPPTFKADQTIVEQTKQIVKQLNINYEIGLIATGDSFISEPSKITKLKQLFPRILAAEMEGAAVAQVCYRYDIPFIIIRALSDIAGKDSPITFEQFLHTAAKNSSNIISSYLESF